MSQQRVGRPGKKRIEQTIKEAKTIETELNNIDNPEPAEEMPPDSGTGYARLPKDEKAAKPSP